MKYKYLIHRKDGKYTAESNNIFFNDVGVWIEDNEIRSFIPYYNIDSIVEFKTKDDK